jgi:hypothetical protein
MKMNPIVTLNIKKASYAFYKLLFCDLGRNPCLTASRRQGTCIFQSRTKKFLTSVTLKILFTITCIGIVRQILRVNNTPRHKSFCIPVLAQIMFFYSAVEIVSNSNVKFFILRIRQYILCNCDLGRNRTCIFRIGI